MSSESVTYQGSGLVFNNTYGSGVSATFQNEIVAAENYLQSVFTNACTVNCNFDLQSINPAYSGENFFSPITVSYSTFVNALAQHATTAPAIAAANSLSNLQDPTQGAGVEVSIGEARILGLAGAGSGTDDSVILNSYYWTASALQSDPGDAEAVVEHEITEGIMGRIGSLGVADSAWAPMDFFRFTASGQRDFTGGADGLATYFSVDGSTVYTGLQFHNSVNSFGQFDGFDLADWDQVGADANAHDPFGPGGPGVGDPGTLSATDITELNVLGWDVASANSPPVVTASNRTATHLQTFAASNLFTASDPDGDAITQYNLWDTGSGGAHISVNGVVQGSRQNITVSTAQLAQITYQSGAGADVVWVRAFDGTYWSSWTSFTVTGPIDLGPIVTPTSGNVSATHNQSFAASSLFTASDPFNDPIIQYNLWDTGTGGAHVSVNGVVQGSQQNITVSIAQLAQTTYQSGLGPDVVWVQASDGTEWGQWVSFIVTGIADPGPIVTPTSGNVSATHNQSFAASSLFTASDPFNDLITQYNLWDTGSGGAHVSVNAVVQGSHQNITISTAQLAQTTYQSGSGPDVVWVQAFDGTEWGPWVSFTVTGPVDPGPTVTPTNGNVSAAHNQSFPASSLFTASDPFNDPINQYNLWDTGTGGAYVLVNGVVQGSHQNITVSTAQLAQTTYQSGSGSDVVWVQAFDGTEWGPWASFTVTAASGASADTGPIVTPTSSNVLATPNESFAASSLFTASDPFNNPVTQYNLWDTGSGGAHLSVNGVVQGSHQNITVSTAQLAQTTYQSGSGSDVVWVQASDGTEWGSWASFTVAAANSTSAGGTRGTGDSQGTPDISLLAGYMASSFVTPIDGHGTSVAASTGAEAPLANPHH